MGAGCAAWSVFSVSASNHNPYSPKIEDAYHLREDLTDLFERDDTKAGAKPAIRVWCKRARERGVAEFESFLGTLDRWMGEITNYLQGRQTSGFVEGFNNGVKVLKRRCYGIFNVGSLFQRLILDRHGYQLFGHTSPHDTSWPTTGISGEPIWFQLRSCLFYGPPP